jgi:hypothetical protein
MEPECSLPHSQELSTSPCLELNQPSLYSYPISCRFVFISSHPCLCLPCGLLTSSLSTKIQYAPLHSPYLLHMSYPSHSSRFHHLNYIWWEVQIIKLLLCSLLHYLFLLCPSKALISSSPPYSQTPLAYVPPSLNDQVSNPYKTTGKIIVLCMLIFVYLAFVFFNRNKV